MKALFNSDKEDILSWFWAIDPDTPSDEYGHTWSDTL